MGPSNVAPSDSARTWPRLLSCACACAEAEQQVYCSGNERHHRIRMRLEGMSLQPKLQFPALLTVCVAFPLRPFAREALKLD
jgi:hypothetical protein